jgi:hypothetical protein
MCHRLYNPGQSGCSRQSTCRHRLRTSQPSKVLVRLSERAKAILVNSSRADRSGTKSAVHSFIDDPSARSGWPGRTTQSILSSEGLWPVHTVNNKSDCAFVTHDERLATIEIRV